MSAAELILALVRTTLAAGAAACLAAVLLAWLRVESPRTHRIAWTLVVLQGWLLIPWTFRWEIAASPQVESTPRIAHTAAWEWSEIRDANRKSLRAASPTLPPPRTLDRVAPAARIVWLAGAAALALAAAWRYARIVRALPRGVAPEEPEWQAEWRRALAAAGGTSKSARGVVDLEGHRARRPRPAEDLGRATRRVALRITERTGPLLAFVPWQYLVLAPRSLWAALASPEREAILRHELAHLRRRDLWKSLAIRALALPQWFNPLIWLAVRRFDEAAEWACDAAACSASNRVTLARSLVRAAELTAAHTAPPRAAGVIPAVRAGRLTHRIHRLVTPRFKEESIMKRLAVPALLAAVAALQIIRIECVVAEDQPSAANGAGEPAPTRLVTYAEWMATPGRDAIASDGEPEERLGVADEVIEGDDPAAEFAARAKLPYVIEPPDILRVTIKPKQGKAIGVSVNDDSMVTGELQLQCLVATDGRVNLGGAGAASSVYVAGLTLEKAEQAIHKRLKRGGGNFKNVDDVVVELLGNNSKVAYVIDEAPNGIGEVVRMPVPYPLDRAFNVAVALEQTGSRPFKLTEARISIARPAANGQGAERILPVVLDAATEAPTADTNHALVPGDRLFVRAPASHVFVIYRNAGAEHVCPLPFKKGATIADAIAAAKLPQPINFDDATISLTRADGPPELGGEVSWAIGWDAEASQPAEDDDRQVQPGDRIVIDASPSRGPVLPNPVFPTPAAWNPPTTGAPGALPAPSPPAPVPSPQLLPILGPITSGPEIVALDPPSDDEVMRVLKNAQPAQGHIPLLWERNHNDVRIVKEKIADYVDPPRSYPLVGRAQHHHAHYQCTINYGYARDVIYIDHNHLHIVGNVDDGSPPVDGAAPPTPLPAPTYATAAAPAPAPGAVVPPPPRGAVQQVMFKMSLIIDRTGDVAELSRDLREAGRMSSDASTIQGAMRIMQKHGLIQTLADPVIVTIPGRPAKLEFAGAAPHKPGQPADVAPQRVSIELRPGEITRDEEGRRMMLDVKLVQGGELHFGTVVHFGETLIAATRHPHPPHNTLGVGQTYLVITPEIVE